MNQIDNLTIKAGLLWDGRSREAVPKATIVIKNGLVAAIGPTSSFSGDLQCDFDWSDYLVMPGLIDCHTHLSMDPTLEHYLDHMMDSAQELTGRAMKMMQKDLNAGVTTCRCLGDRELVDVTCKETVEEHPTSGPETLIAIRGIKKINAPGFVGYPFAGKEEMRQAVVDNVALGADLTKIYLTGTLKDDREIRSYLNLDEIELVIDQSHKLGVPITAHCVGGPGLDWALELGIDSVEHLYHVSEQQLDQLAASNTWPVLTPSPILTESRVRNLPEPLIAGHLREKVLMTESMSALVNSGIPYAVGTDGMHGELVQELRYLISMGASAFDALSAATYHSACASGIEKHTGSLEPGKRADLIAVKGNPLLDIDALCNIIAVIKKGIPVVLMLLVIVALGCSESRQKGQPRISLVNSPTDIVTLGAQFLAQEINKKTNGAIQPEVFHSGVLSGGKGLAEIEMTQQGSIQIHITSTAYLSNLAAKTSIVSLPFMFDDLEQVVRLLQSNSNTLHLINEELKQKNLAIIAWWPRGFRQLTNSRRPVKKIEDIRGLKFRVMNNQLFVDNMNAMGAHPVPMEWGEVYNGLQLKTIDGQENAEDVIYSSKLYEIQPYMTIWDYSTDLEVVMVNLQWWDELPDPTKTIIKESADASTDLQITLLKKNTRELREKIAKNGVAIHYLNAEARQVFKSATMPVWDKYELVFGSEFTRDFLSELEEIN